LCNNRQYLGRSNVFNVQDSLTGVNVRIIQETEYDMQVPYADVLKKKEESGVSFVEAAKILVSEIGVQSQYKVGHQTTVHINGSSRLNSHT